MKGLIALSVLAVGGGSLSACATADVAQKKLGVEIYVKGSDIETEENSLTKTLRNKLEAAVTESERFSLSEANRGEIIILLPELVHVNGNSVTYRAHISRKSDGVSSDITGSCSKQDIGICADRIIGDALDVYR